MLRSNADRICAELGPNDRVLDIGGWYQPFNRADVVVDLLPYETRGTGGYRGPEKERFTADTWIQHDVSSRRPLPFRDREFDFVTCAHVLEDIRDPVGLCSELMRVAKRGYIETPSRLVEQTYGLEGRNYAGYYHHRWLVEMGDGEVRFRHKPHLLHGHWPCHFPRSVLRDLPEERWVTFMFWEDRFDAYEVVSVSQIEVRRELEEFVRRHYRYPAIYRWLDSDWPGAEPRIRPRQVVKKLLQLLPGLRDLGRPPVAPSIWDGFYEVESRAFEPPRPVPRVPRA